MTMRVAEVSDLLKGVEVGDAFSVLPRDLGAFAAIMTRLIDLQLAYLHESCDVPVWPRGRAAPENHQWVVLVAGKRWSVGEFLAVAQETLADYSFTPM